MTPLCFHVPCRNLASIVPLNVENWLVDCTSYDQIPALPTPRARPATGNKMALDFVLRNARIAGSEPHTCDIGVAGGRIAAIAERIDAEVAVEDLAGKLVVPGFVETHLHLDKSCILDRCKSREGTLTEAIAQLAAAKREFSEDTSIGGRSGPWKKQSCRGRCICAAC